MLGAASSTQLSPLAAPWRGWLLLLLASAHWKPSLWLSMAMAEEEEGAGVGWGVILLLGHPSHGLPFSMWQPSQHQGVEETLNTHLGPWC